MTIIQFMNNLAVQENGCWLWTKGKTGEGYGAFWVRLPDGTRKQMKTHRFSWEHHRGPIPDGMCICHHCDTPLCCNPTHMFLGTPADNNADRDAKKRHVTSPGEKNGMAKLSEKDVQEIRNLYATNEWSQQQIADKYNTSQTCISKIITGLRWSSI